MLCARVTFLVLVLTASSAVGQNIIQAGPQINDLSATVGSVVTAVVAIGITGGFPGVGPAAVRFKYTGVTPVNTAQPAPPDFLVVFPSSGTTSTDILNSTQLLIGLNESVVRGMGPGNYGLNVVFSTVDQSPPSQTGVGVFLHLHAPGPPTITSVVNGASHQPAISPGAIVSILGTNFGPPVLATQHDDTGLYPTALTDGIAAFGNTTVTFNGIAAPLLYVSASRIDAVVPSGVAGQQTADVVVTCYTQSTAPFTVPILDIAPGIFTARRKGTGQPILNAGLYSSTINSASNPAPKGSAITLFATGFGAWDPPVPDGAIALIASNPLCRLSGDPQCRMLAANPVSLTIGGLPAMIFYAGVAPYQPWGVLQINAYVPVDVDSGPQPVVLTIGDNDNSQQQVTVAVQ